MSSTDTPIGFIGLGNMGGPMAGHLAEKGFPVVCHDASGTQGKAHPKAQIAASNAEVAKRCEVAITSLPDGAVVNRVVGEFIAVKDRKTQLFVDTSTIGIEWAKQNAREAAAAGIEYVDAPVSGGASGARAGTIAVMCAGRKQTIDRLRDTLLAFGGHVFQVGEEARPSASDEGVEQLSLWHGDGGYRRGHSIRGPGRSRYEDDA